LAAVLIATALIASTLLTTGLPFGLVPGLPPAEAAFPGGFPGAVLATGLAAGLGDAFLAGAGCFVFDFAADFDAITILCAARAAADTQKGGATEVAPPERIKAGSPKRSSLSPD
jgi:hypothetical protein